MYTMGAVEYLNPVGSAHYGYFGELPSGIKTVMDAQKKMLGTDDGWGYWTGSAVVGIGQESGKDVSNLTYFINQGKGVSVAEKAKLFGRLKAKAKAYGAPETAQKIAEGAKWFYDNVENKGKKKSSSGGSSSGGSKPSAPPVTPPSGIEVIWRDYKVPVIVAGGLVGLGIVYLIFSD